MQWTVIVSEQLPQNGICNTERPNRKMQGLAGSIVRCVGIIVVSMRFLECLQIGLGRAHLNWPASLSVLVLQNFHLANFVLQTLLGTGSLIENYVDIITSLIDLFGCRRKSGHARKHYYVLFKDALKRVP